jgi:hypothetical protein
VAAGVTGQVNQQIDPLLQDGLPQGLNVEAAGLDPALGSRWARAVSSSCIEPVETPSR